MSHRYEVLLTNGDRIYVDILSRDSGFLCLANIDVKEAEDLRASNEEWRKENPEDAALFRTPKLEVWTSQAFISERAVAGWRVVKWVEGHYEAAS